MSAGAIILAFALFQLKHYLADFHWQTIWMVETKGRYGHPGGLAHSGLHGLLSLPVLLVAAPWMPALTVVLILAEIAAHYDIDWLKSRIVTRRGLGEDDSVYWHLFGLDQAAHHLTYIGMVAILLGAAG